MANVGPNFWYLWDTPSTAGWSAVTAWPTSTAKGAGTLVRQNAAPTAGNERVFVAVVGGTTGGTEPTWVITKGAKTTDNTVTWQECTGQPGVNGDTTNSPTWLQNKNTAVTLGLIIYDSVSSSLQIVSTAGTTGNGSQPSFSATAGTTTADNTVTWTSLGLASNFAKWAAPFAKMQSAPASGWMAASNTLFVSDTHAETQSPGGNVSITFGASYTVPAKVYCVDHTATFPLTSANVTTGAVVQTTGATNLIPNGDVYMTGITFKAGSGAVNSNFQFNAAGNSAIQRYDNCAFQKLGTNGSTNAIAAGGTNKTIVYLNNCTMQFGSTSDRFHLFNAVFFWSNTPSAITGATIPTTLFDSPAPGSMMTVDGVDLSAITGTLFAAPQEGFVINSMTRCQLNSGVTLASTPSFSQNFTNFASNDSGATTYKFQRYSVYGTLIPETTVVRTNGASNGATSVSYNVTTTSGSTWFMPFEAIPITIWNPTTGSNVTVTVCGIINAAALPNNDDIWMDVEYFGSSGSPLATFNSGTKANGLAAGSALSSDTSAWDSVATARANSTGYSVGNIIKVASNPGRIFFCTTGGTSAASEPGGYATAIDGGSVTDGTAVFRAGVRFKFATTLSSPQPQLAGYLQANIKAAKISTTWYVDPLVTLS